MARRQIPPRKYPPVEATKSVVEMVDNTKVMSTEKIEQTVAVVSCKILNLRAKPDKTSLVLTVLHADTRLVVLSTSGEWMSVFVEEEPTVSGCVMSQYVEVV